MRVELRAWAATHPLACVGEWNSADPLFVKLTFTEGGKDVTWDIPREALLTGMELRPGGDMGIRRDLAHDLVVITIHGYDDAGHAMVAEIALTALPLDGWLETTDNVVPIGGEMLAVDWNQLTRGAEPEAPVVPAEGEFRDAYGEIGDCRVCLPETEARKYLDFTKAGSCPLCGRKLR